MKQPTINNIPIGRYNKIKLYNIIVSQEKRIQNLLYLLGQSTRVNKKNLEYFKKLARQVQPEPNELRDCIS